MTETDDNQKCAEDGDKSKPDAQPQSIVVLFGMPHVDHSAMVHDAILHYFLTKGSR